MHPWCTLTPHCTLLKKNWMQLIAVQRAVKGREDARLSSSEDFATGKCRSIDRLAEKGFLHQKLKQTKFAKQKTVFSYPVPLSHLKCWNQIKWNQIKQPRRGASTHIFSATFLDKYIDGPTISWNVCFWTILSINYSNFRKVHTLQQIQQLFENNINDT